jgi:hypothetical protein
LPNANQSNSASDESNQIVAEVVASDSKQNEESKQQSDIENRERSPDLCNQDTPPQQNELLQANSEIIGNIADEWKPTSESQSTQENKDHVLADESNSAYLPPKNTDDLISIPQEMQIYLFGVLSSRFLKEVLLLVTTYF